MRSLQIIFASALTTLVTIHAHAGLVNSAASGNRVSNDGGPDDMYSFSYDNTGGEYLVLGVVAASQNTLAFPSSGIEVSFDGTPLSLLQSTNTNDTNYVVQYYTLANPTSGTGTISVDFNANIATATGNNDTDIAGWQFGVVSLTNVNEADPIAFSGTMPSAGGTFTDADITPGDFFLMVQGSFNTIGSPNYLTPTGETPTGSTVPFFHQDNASGLRSYDAEYAELSGGDIATGGEITFSPNGTTRTSGQRPFVIFNVVPEPGSLGLVAGLGLLALRRRR